MGYEYRVGILWDLATEKLTDADISFLQRCFMYSSNHCVSLHYKLLESSIHVYLSFIKKGSEKGLAHDSFQQIFVSFQHSSGSHGKHVPEPCHI